MPKMKYSGKIARILPEIDCKCLFLPIFLKYYKFSYFFGFLLDFMGFWV